MVRQLSPRGSCALVGFSGHLCGSPLNQSSCSGAEPSLQEPVGRPARARTPPPPLPPVSLPPSEVPGALVEIPGSALT